MRDNEKEDARKRGGADKRGGTHSRYQFFRCGKLGGGGADKQWGALWRYSTVYISVHYYIRHARGSGSVSIHMYIYFQGREDYLRDSLSLFKKVEAV